MITTAKEYMEERYHDLEIAFLNDTGRRLGQQFSHIRTYCLRQWQQILSEAVEEQKKLHIPCAYMSISLLNTSLFTHRPQWQVDFYDGEWFYGAPWFRGRMSVNFLFEEWEDFCRKALDGRFYVRSSIPPASIKALFWETADKLAYLAAGFAKYWASDIGQLPEFIALDKESAMYVTCGVYLDWQERIYGVLPPLDLTSIPDNEETTFREFSDMVYHEISISDLDLRHNRFYRTDFRQVVFKTVDIRDAYFEDCTFDNVHFIEVRTAGCRWVNCRLKRCTWQNSGTAVEEDEYFAEAEMTRTHLTDTQILNSDFSHFILSDCRINHLNMVNTLTDHASWSAYREAEGNVSAGMVPGT